MRRLERIAVFSIAACCFVGARADVRDTAAERALSLPAGTPALVLKRGDWIIVREQRKAGDTAVYYMLSSDSTGMAFSVYIDKSTVCQAAEACIREALKNPAYKDAMGMQNLDAGALQAVRFYLDRPMGTPVKQAHILAAAYVDGHWFDIHISKTGAERPDIAPMVELLNSLVIR
jgi:hypothetical protein